MSRFSFVLESGGCLVASDDDPIVFVGCSIWHLWCRERRPNQNRTGAGGVYSPERTISSYRRYQKIVVPTNVCACAFYQVRLTSSSALRWRTVSVYDSLLCLAHSVQLCAEYICTHISSSPRANEPKNVCQTMKGNVAS